MGSRTGIMIRGFALAKSLVLDSVFQDSKLSGGPSNLPDHHQHGTPAIDALCSASQVIGHTPYEQ